MPIGTDDVVIPNVGAKSPLITTNVEGQVNNLSIDIGGVLEVNGSGGLNLGSNGSTVTNNGTIKTSGSSDAASIVIYGSGQFINNGSIDIFVGVFNMYFYTSSTQTGSFSGQYGRINLHGNAGVDLTFNSGSVITVNNIYFDYIPTVNIHGTVNQNWPDSHFEISGSTVNIYYTQPNTLGDVSITTGMLWFIMAGTVTGSCSIPLSATLKGTGTITGDLTNAGIISPGSSPSIISAGGIYTQASTGVLVIELGGTDPGTGYDQLAVTGTAALSGTLDVSLIDPFNPVLGQTFTIMTYGSHTGEFNTVNLPELGAGLDWEITYGATSVQLDVMEGSYFVYLPLIMR